MHCKRVSQGVAHVERGYEGEPHCGTDSEGAPCYERGDEPMLLGETGGKGTLHCKVAERELRAMGGLGQR